MLNSKLFLNYAKRFRSYFVSLQPIFKNPIRYERDSKHNNTSFCSGSATLRTDMLCAASIWYTMHMRYRITKSSRT